METVGAVSGVNGATEPGTGRRMLAGVYGCCFGLVDGVVGSLAARVKVALGLEFPLWLPTPDCARCLSAGCAVDGNMPWSASAAPRAWFGRATPSLPRRAP